jgi:signal peptidase
MLGQLNDAGRLVGRFALRAGLALALLVLLGIGIGPVTGRYRVVTVLTGSMRPTAPPGSMVVSTPQSAAAVRVGQVITFQAPIDGHPVVTHRVVEVVSGGTHPVIRTKGDANAAPDPWDARLGDGPVWRMRGMVPGAGQAMAVARSPLVHRITVLAAPLAFALFVVIGIWKDDPDT